MTPIIDTYISQFPDNVQKKLIIIKKTIQTAVPDAREDVRYGMPTFILHGNLVHFAAYRHHIWFYPTPSAIVAFADQLAQYKTSKGAIQFPIDEALPLTLIRRIVAFRVKENIARWYAKSKNTPT